MNKPENKPKRKPALKKPSFGKESARKPIAEKPAPVQKPASAVSAFRVTLNSKTARDAVVLSEIIGKPVSKRGRRR